MANNLVNKEKSIITNLSDMIGSGEVVKQVSRKTTIKTNVGEHTAWEIFKPNGNKALFTSFKKN